MLKGALLDTGFLIRLLVDTEPLHQSANLYYKYFLEQQIPLFLSTISVAEYCVKGKVDELPLRQLRLLPFNLKEAIQAGSFAHTALAQRGILDLPERKVIINDLKLYAQAHVHVGIDSFVTADSAGKKLYSSIQRDVPLHFNYIDINTPYTTTFGILL